MVQGFALAAGSSTHGTHGAHGTRRVGPGEAYLSPAEAIAAARPGDTIRVAAGLYRGSLSLDRRVVLIGTPGAVLDGGRSGTVVSVTGDSAEIRGFRITHSGTSLNQDDAAVKLVRCTGCAVVGNTIESSLHGIYLLSSHDVLISDNRIRGHPGLQEAWRGNGIHLYNSTHVEITGNTLRATRDGMYFSFASFSTVIGNDVSGVRYGLHYMYSDDNSFSGNRFTRNAAGAAIMFSKRIIFRDNTFSEHVGYRAYGILLQTADQVTAERNVIQGNLTGLFLDGSTGSVFTDNTISGNGVGIDMMASSEGNTFTANVITDNRTAVRKVLGAGENSWDAGGRGNFWGDRSIYDLDGDGTGDRPYIAGDPFASLAAIRPVLELWTGTPAARALSWAESAFAVFDFPAVTDEHPLTVRPASAPYGSAAAASRWSTILLIAGIWLLGFAVRDRSRMSSSRNLQ